MAERTVGHRSFVRQRVNRVPQPTKLDGVHVARGRTRGRRLNGRALANASAPDGALAVERQAKGHADEPGPESAAVAKLGKPRVGPDERVLGHVLSVLTLPEDTVGHTEREGRGVRQAGLELAEQRLVHRYRRSRQALHAFVHNLLDAAGAPLVHPGCEPGVESLGGSFSRLGNRPFPVVSTRWSAPPSDSTRTARLAGITAAAQAAASRIAAATR